MDRRILFIISCIAINSLSGEEVEKPPVEGPLAVPPPTYPEEEIDHNGWFRAQQDLRESSRERDAQRREQMEKQREEQRRRAEEREQQRREQEKRLDEQRKQREAEQEKWRQERRRLERLREEELRRRHK